MSPTPPSTIGRYQIVRRLGAGGMGTVYLARDPELDRQVAIKLVKDDLTDDPELRARFSREARAAARLSHPNIITIFDIGEDGGRLFIAMEYVEGESLADMIRRQALLTLDQILGYMQALCEGLAHAHRAGIVHRDVKPANVLVGLDGMVKIVDFGIARLGDSQVTRDGVLLGTLNYMAPEQVQGRGVDARSDEFAVGCVFYEVLTFGQAFSGGVTNGLMGRITNADPPALAQLVPDLPREVIAIVETALQKDPERRFPDLSVMAKDVADARAAASLTGSYQDWVTGRFDTSDLLAARQAAPSGRPLASSNARPSGWGAQAAPSAPSLESSPDAKRALAEARERLRQSDLTGAASLLDQASNRLGSDQASDVRSDLQRLRQELDDARQRRERLCTLLARAREQLAANAPDVALAAAEEALMVDPSATEARLFAERAKAALDDRRRQTETTRVRQLVEQARQHLADGRGEEALALVANVAGSSDSETASLQEIREKAAEARRQRQRQVEVFMDAAELAASQGDYAKALSLVADTARLAPAAPGLEDLRKQAQAALDAARASERRRLELLDAIARALDGGNLSGARAQIEQVFLLNTADEDGRARALRSRLRQAERAAAEEAGGAARNDPDAARAAGARGLSPVVILVVLALLGAAGAALYHFFFRG